MSDDTTPSRAKPDGSVYEQHLKAIAERNAATQKAGRTQRQGREERQLGERLARERHTDQGLSGRGKAGSLEAPRSPK
jgi:hypothetical protein